jgi:hypothetical protein
MWSVVHEPRRIRYYCSWPHYSPAQLVDSLYHRGPVPSFPRVMRSSQVVSRQYCTSSSGHGSYREKTVRTECLLLPCFPLTNAIRSPLPVQVIAGGQHRGLWPNWAWWESMKLVRESKLELTSRSQR